MTNQPSQDKLGTAKECLHYLGQENGVLPRAAHVLEIVAHSSVGLGEVLQDFAHQAWGQLNDVIRAAQHTESGTQTEDDVNALQHTQITLQTVKKVLEMTPVAMQRNKAETIGDKEKISQAEITLIANAFANLPAIERLLASEELGDAMVELSTATTEAPQAKANLQ